MRGPAGRVTISRLLPALVASLVLLAGCAQRTDPDATLPSFELPDLRDPSRTVSSADLEGSPAVVNFFASWCAPCKRELPTLAAAARRLEGRVRFLGVDHEDVRDEGAALLDRYDIPYPAGYDPDGTVLLKLAKKGLPVTVFVAPDGRIVSLKLGELSEAELDDRIDQLLEAA